MKRETLIAWAGSIITLGLIALFTSWGNSAMWGMNLPAFLPAWWLWALGAIALIVTVVAFAPHRDPGRQAEIGTGPAARVWSPFGEIALSLAFGVLFYQFIAETYFLGDGYTLIAVFGVEGSVVRQWPEPGSYLLVRLLQHALGGETRETLIRGMQLLSVGAGVVYVFASLHMPRYFSDSRRVRALLSITLITSGTMLLFFGYVEYYHVLWAAGLVYLTLAIRYIRTGRGLAVTLLSAGLMAIVHFESLALMPGTALLAIDKFWPSLKSRLVHLLSVRWLFLLALVLGFLLIYALESLARTDIFLPILPFDPATQGYAVLSWTHALDLLNESFVIFPGILIMAAIMATSRRSPSQDQLATFLGLSSYGAALFLITVNPVLGIGRDWDLMSFALLPIGLYLIHRYEMRLTEVTWRVVLTYFLVGAFVTGAFVAANITRGPSEARFESLLRYYGAREESGWAIFDYYLLNRGRMAEVAALSREMLARGIREADAHYALGKTYRAQKQTDAAVAEFESALALKPGNARWLNDLGQSYLDQGRASDAAAVLREARRRAPEWTSPLESLALVAIRSNDDSLALAYADTLLMQDANSAGGHLIYLVVELSRGNRVEAAHHYQAFLKFGRGRSDYDGIREYYGPMLQ